MSDDDLARSGAFDQARLATRAFDEMLGLCRGILVDGEVTDQEIVALERWCSAFPEIVGTWPGDVVARRVRLALADGFVEESERKELQEVLVRLTGMADAGEFTRPSQLPLTEPAPTIVYPDRLFCLTGTFTFGRRAACEAVIVARGGRTKGSVIRTLDYLVIGNELTPAWVHSTHGRKIEEAVEWVRRGASLAIVSEEHWSRSLL